MSHSPSTRERFIEALKSNPIASETDRQLTSKLREALLDFASETPDNINCTGLIEIGRVAEEKGVKLRNREYLLSDIAHAMEDMPPPDSLKTAFPDLLEKDWDAFTRLTTLIYLALNCDLPSNN